MSNNKHYRNYQNYSNNQNKVNKETPVEEKQEVTEQIVEETVEQPELEDAVETVDVEATEEPVEELAVEKPNRIGTVVDCAKLNVRKAASKESDSVGIIDAGCEVEIDEEKSTSEFYKICTAAGLEGFCMKKFIQIVNS